VNNLTGNRRKHAEFGAIELPVLLSAVRIANSIHNCLKGKYFTSIKQFYTKYLNCSPQYVGSYSCKLEQESASDDD
jgi:hypothetical protein